MSSPLTASGVSTEPESNTITACGSCLCKSITYEITGQPRLSILCHCNHCQKTSGSALGAFVNFASEEQLTLSDPQTLLRWYTTEAASGRPLKRSFCSKCGSSLIIKSGSDPSRGVTVPSGTIDDIRVLEEGKGGEKWKPIMSLFCMRKRGWVPEVGGVEGFESVPAGM